MTCKVVVHAAKFIERHVFDKWNGGATNKLKVIWKGANCETAIHNAISP